VTREASSKIDVEEIAMSKPTDTKVPAPKSKAAGVDRRRFFLMGGSAAVAAATVVPLSSAANAEESQAERVKARYKETDHVKNYYRVNRY
jgi:secreted PhoX family phosphatase